MEHVLCEPVELTEFELDAVAGGNPFGSVFGSVTNVGVSNVLNANANGAGSEAETVGAVDVVATVAAVSNFLNG
jgi:hypothetical protein